MSDKVEQKRIAADILIAALSQANLTIGIDTHSDDYHQQFAKRLADSYKIILKAVSAPEA